MVAFSTSYGEQKLERQQISRQDQGGGHLQPLSPQVNCTLQGVHNLARATPILGMCHGVITERCVFRYISEHFLPPNGRSAPSMSTFEV